VLVPALKYQYPQLSGLGRNHTDKRTISASKLARRYLETISSIFAGDE
jgi:hypothetical protein